MVSTSTRGAPAELGHDPAGRLDAVHAAASARPSGRRRACSRRRELDRLARRRRPRRRPRVAGSASRIMPEAGAHERLVVGEHDAGHGRSSQREPRRATREAAAVAGPGVAARRRTGAARSRMPTRPWPGAGLGAPPARGPSSTHLERAARRRRSVTRDVARARAAACLQRRWSAPPARSGRRSRSTPAASARGSPSTAQRHVERRPPRACVDEIAELGRARLGHQRRRPSPSSRSTPSSRRISSSAVRAGALDRRAAARARLRVRGRARAAAAPACIDDHADGCGRRRRAARARSARAPRPPPRARPARARARGARSARRAARPARAAAARPGPRPSAAPPRAARRSTPRRRPERQRRARRCSARPPSAATVDHGPRRADVARRASSRGGKRRRSPRKQVAVGRDQPRRATAASVAATGCVRCQATGQRRRERDEHADGPARRSGRRR